MRHEAEKSTKSRDDLLIGSMVQHEETVTGSSVLKKIQREPQIAPKIADTDRQHSDDDDEEK